MYNIPLGGGLFKGPWAIGGSGSTYVYGWCDATYREDWNKDETVKFVTESASPLLVTVLAPSLLPDVALRPVRSSCARHESRRVQRGHDPPRHHHRGRRRARLCARERAAACVSFPPPLLLSFSLVSRMTVSSLGTDSDMRAHTEFWEKA